MVPIETHILFLSALVYDVTSAESMAKYCEGRVAKKTEAEGWWSLDLSAGWDASRRVDP